MAKSLKQILGFRKDRETGQTYPITASKQQRRVQQIAVTSHFAGVSPRGQRISGDVAVARSGDRFKVGVTGNVDGKSIGVHGVDYSLDKSTMTAKIHNLSLEAKGLFALEASWEKAGVKRIVIEHPKNPADLKKLGYSESNGNYVKVLGKDEPLICPVNKKRCSRANCKAVSKIATVCPLKN